MADNKEKSKNDYKIIIAELGVNPFHVVNIIFALVCVIPLLAVCYIVVGRHLLYDIFMGLDGAQMSIAIMVALAGLFYAYSLVRNLTEKLLTYAEERRRADSEKEEFMMSVSRDLKAPLEVIKFEMGNINAGVTDVVRGIIGDTVKKCLNATNRLAGLIENIINFPSTGFVRTSMDRKLVDLREIVKAGLSSAEPFAKNNNTDVRTGFVTENANLWGDEKKLSRMATTLIYNAIRSAPQGGIINVSVSSDDDTVRLAVENRSPGLSPKEQDVVFEHGVQAADCAGRADVASEISVAKDIIELHNGHLTINNDPDKELGFKIVLPRDLRARKGMTGLGRDIRNKADSMENENINTWLSINRVLTEIVSKSKATKQR